MLCGRDTNWHSGAESGAAGGANAGGGQQGGLPVLLALTHRSKLLPKAAALRLANASGSGLSHPARPPGSETPAAAAAARAGGGTRAAQPVGKQVYPSADKGTDRHVSWHVDWQLDSTCLHAWHSPPSCKPCDQRAARRRCLAPTCGRRASSRRASSSERSSTVGSAVCRKGSPRGTSAHSSGVSARRAATLANTGTLVMVVSVHHLPLPDAADVAKAVLMGLIINPGVFLLYLLHLLQRAQQQRAPASPLLCAASSVRAAAKAALLTSC